MNLIGQSGNLSLLNDRLVLLKFDLLELLRNSTFTDHYCRNNFNSYVHKYARIKFLHFFMDLSIFPSNLRKLQRLGALKINHYMVRYFLLRCHGNFLVDGWLLFQHAVGVMRVRYRVCLDWFVLDLGFRGNNFQKAAQLRPDSGHAKFMYLGQMSSGREALDFFQRGVDLMLKEDPTNAACTSSTSKIFEKDVAMTMYISNAYCSMAEVYLTDLWSVSVPHNNSLQFLYVPER